MSEKIDMNNTDTGSPQTVRFRTITASLLADRTTEADIQRLYFSHEKSIQGFGYVLHSECHYVENEVIKLQKDVEHRKRLIDDSRYCYATQDEYNKALAEQDARLVGVEVGLPKPAHWHILADFGNTPQPVDSLAKCLNCEPNMICKVEKGKKGFANMMAYLSHKTSQAIEDGKRPYSSNDIKMFKLPPWEEFKNISNYDKFIEAYQAMELGLDKDAVAVLKGKVTPDELLEKKPSYYLNNINKIKRARLEYINRLPTPPVLFNFFVGAYDPENNGGRIGKGLASYVLAISHLKGMFPDVNFENLTRDEICRKYLFYAGNEGVTLQDYDGQPIIIWEDIRSYELIKIFGGINRLFKALDTHPKPTSFNIKYGSIQLKNSINIFNGVETYADFTSNLSKEWRDSSDGRRLEVKEDKSQAVGRFPFFIEISPSFITAGASLAYMIGNTSHDFKRTFKNDLIAIAQHNRLAVDTEWLGLQYKNAEKVVDEMPDKLSIPDKAFAEIDLELDYQKFITRWQEVNKKDIMAGTKRSDGYAGFQDWVKYGANTDYDEKKKCWYRPE